MMALGMGFQLSEVSNVMVIGHNVALLHGHSVLTGTTTASLLAP